MDGLFQGIVGGSGQFFVPQTKNDLFYAIACKMLEIFKIRNKESVPQQTLNLDQTQKVKHITYLPLKVVAFSCLCYVQTLRRETLVYLFSECWHGHCSILQLGLGSQVW